MHGGKEAPVRGVDWRSGVVLLARADGELGTLFHRKFRIAILALELPAGLQVIWSMMWF